MLADDSEETALRSTKIFQSPNIKHFYDPNQRSGKAVATSIGWEDKIVWDIYLFYKSSLEWIEEPPEPACWMHQLTEYQNDREHYCTGEDLVQGLASSLKKLL